MFYQTYNRMYAAGRAQKCHFLPGGLDVRPWLSKSSERRTKINARLKCEFGTNPFSGSATVATIDMGRKLGAMPFLRGIDSI